MPLAEERRRRAGLTRCPLCRTLTHPSITSVANRLPRGSECDIVGCNDNRAFAADGLQLAGVESIECADLAAGDLRDVSRPSGPVRRPLAPNSRLVR